MSEKTKNLLQTIVGTFTALSITVAAVVTIYPSPTATAFHQKVAEYIPVSLRR